MTRLITRRHRQHTGTANTRSWIIEPQIEYNYENINFGDINLLAGASMLGADNNTNYLYGRGYPNDLFYIHQALRHSYTPAIQLRSIGMLQHLQGFHITWIILTC